MTIAAGMTLKIPTVDCIARTLEQFSLEALAFYRGAHPDTIPASPSSAGLFLDGCLSRSDQLLFSNSDGEDRPGYAICFLETGRTMIARVVAVLSELDQKSFFDIHQSLADTLFTVCPVRKVQFELPAPLVDDFSDSYERVGYSVEARYDRDLFFRGNHVDRVAYGKLRA